MKKQLIYAALAMTTFVACTNDEEHVANLESPVEATFIGQVNLVNTRGEDNSTETTATPTTEAWTDTYATIGISALKYTNSSQKEAEYANVKYTTTLTSGSSTYNASFETENKFYFQTPSEKASFVAYAPYVAASSSTSDYADGVIDVHANDESSSDFAVTDYIWAQTDELDYSHPQASLQFAHKMVKLNITAVLSSEVSLSNTVSIKSATLSNLITDGSLTLSTGVVATDEAPAKRDVSLAVSSTDATQAALTDFIALPQSGLVLTITTTDGNSYQSTLNQSLTSGNAYTFTVTAKKSALDVKAEITSWITEGNSKEKDAGMTVLPIGDVKKASDAWLYDLAFSDGTFMHTTESNGGDFKESISLTDNQKSELRGIVYYQGDVTEDDQALKNDYPDCKHGLIVALNNADGSKWQSTGEWIYNTFQKTSDIYSGYKGVSVTTYDVPKTDYTDYSDIYITKLGYNNTVVLRAYNESKKSSGESDKIVMPIVNIDALTNKAPAGSSGWYIPCPLEATFLLTNQLTELRFENFQYNKYDVRTKLNEIFEKLSGLGITVSKISDGDAYWLSLELNMVSYNTVAGSVININTDYFFWSYSYKTDSHVTRPICAY